MSDATEEAPEPDDSPVLEQIDKAYAAHILKRLKSGDATSADLEAIRKYLDFKGYRGASLEAVKKTGVKSDPRLDLGNIPDSVLESFS